MEPSLAHGFHAEFQRIQNALKKSLFKRVDYAGSCSELLELGAALRREGSAPNAAMCLLAAAQCQKALENATAAAHCEAQAGQLLSQELHLAAAGVDDATFELLLPDAARCYLGAINIYLEHEHWSLAGNLYADLANELEETFKDSALGMLGANAEKEQVEEEQQQDERETSSSLGALSENVEHIVHEASRQTQSESQTGGGGVPLPAVKRD